MQTSYLKKKKEINLLCSNGNVMACQGSMRRMLHREEKRSPWRKRGLETLFCILRVSTKTLVLTVLRFLDPCSYFETGGKCSWSHWVLLSAGINSMTCSSGEFTLGRRKLLSLGARCHGALLYMINNRRWRKNWLRAFGGLPDQAFSPSESPFPFRLQSSWLLILCCNSGRDSVRDAERRSSYALSNIFGHSALESVATEALRALYSDLMLVGLALSSVVLKILHLLQDL